MSKPTPLKVYGRSHYACTRCKVSKIKCSGDHPCKNCKNINKPDGCVYPSRNRKIVIMESDLDALNDRVRFLETQLASKPTHAVPTASIQPHLTNPTVQERLNEETKEFLFNDSGLQNFLLSDESNEMLSWKMSLCQNSLPDKQTALKLVEKVLTHYATEFYLIDLSTLLPMIDRIYESGVNESGSLNRSETVSREMLCYIFAVLAFGEQISNINYHEDNYPGIGYYLIASELFNLTKEEVSLHFVQAAGLLALYSANLNRYNSVYHYFGVAMRAAISQGLHRSKQIDPQDSNAIVLQEKRKRVWWTIFIIDATWTAKMNMPAQIDYTETDVDLPNENPLELHDSFDSNMLELNVHLAKYISQSVKAIYGANMRTISVNYINTEQFNQRQLINNVVNCYNDLINNFEIPFLYQFKQSNIIEAKGRILANLFLRFNLLIVHITKPLLTLIFEKYSPGLVENPQEVHEIVAKSIAVSVSTIEILLKLFQLNRVFIIGFYDSQYLFTAILTLVMTALDDKRSEDIINKALALLNFMTEKNNINAQNCLVKLRQVNHYLMQTPKTNFSLNFNVNINDYLSTKAPSAHQIYFNPYSDEYSMSQPQSTTSFLFEDQSKKTKSDFHSRPSSGGYQYPPQPERNIVHGVGSGDKDSSPPYPAMDIGQIELPGQIRPPQSMPPRNQYAVMNPSHSTTPQPILNEGDNPGNRLYNLNESTQNIINSIHSHNIQSWDDFKSYQT